MWVSAGNEDLYKAMQVMELEGRELESPVDVISVANPKKWVAVGAVVGTYAACSLITGVEVGIAKVGSTMGPAISATAAKVAGKWTELTQPTGVPGPEDLLLKKAKRSTNKYHSFEGYANRNVGGVKDAIEGLKEGSDERF